MADMNDRAEQNLESGEVDGRPPLEGQAEPDDTVAAQDRELGLSENEQLESGDPTPPAGETDDEADRSERHD